MFSLLYILFRDDKGDVVFGLMGSEGIDIEEKKSKPTKIGMIRDLNE